jgi:uncharacterized protein (DUF362 family)
MSLVSFVKAREDSTNSLKHDILESLNLIDYSFRKETRNVVIKPNMFYYSDFSTGQTTDPKFVTALIDLIRERISPNTEISIVESDASAMKCKYGFKILGYEKLSREHNVNLINLSKDKADMIDVTAGRESYRFMVPKTIRNADLRINVPKIKYGVRTKISCSLKNIFGCNPYPDKFKYHQELDEAIVALNKAMGFDLHIIDGIIVSGSQIRKLNLVMASIDPVAIDAAAAKILGINPKSVRHIMLASKEGLGATSFVPKGVDPKSFKRLYPKRRLTNKVLSSAYKLATWAHMLNKEML